MNNLKNEEGVMNTIYVISQNEEHFNCGDYVSKEEAISNGLEEFSGEGFFVGRKLDYTLPVPSAQEFFESLVERDYDRLGDWSEFWESSFSKSIELKKLIDIKLEEIQDLIMKEHKPDFFLVEDVEWHEPEVLTND